MEPPEYTHEYYSVLDRSSRSSGFWMDSFISDDDDELHYKPAMGSYVEIFADSSIEERRHFVMGLEHGMRTRYWPGGRLRARSYYKDGNYHGYEKGFDEDGNLSWCVYYHHGVKLADFHGYELLE